MKVKTIILKTAVSAGVKASAAFIAFFMTASVTRIVGAEQAGLFLLAFSILSFSAVFFRLGLDNVLLRVLSAAKDGPSFEVMSTGIIWSVLAASLFSILVFINAELIATKIFSKPSFAGVLSIMIWVLPCMVVFQLISVGFQASYKVITVIWFQNLGISTIFLLTFFGAFLYIDELNAVVISAIYLFSGLIIFMLSISLWNKHINGRWGDIRIKNSELWGSSSNLWAASSMVLLVQWSGILIAGVYATSAEVAYLSAAQRTATLTSFILIVVNMVVAPRYALLWQENKISEIKKLSRWSTRGMIVLALPLVAVMTFIPGPIMGLFGDEFLVAGNLLSIMAIGQFINVATGSVGYLLTMSGHEKDYRRVTFFAGPLTVILSYFLILEYGVLGAAIATAIGLSLQNLLALAMVRKRLGFWPIG